MVPKCVPPMNHIYFFRFNQSHDQFDSLLFPAPSPMQSSLLLIMGDEVFDYLSIDFDVFYSQGFSRISLQYFPEWKQRTKRKRLKYRKCIERCRNLTFLYTS